MVVGGRYSGGQSPHRQPLFSTCKMPLITRRSSTRSLPRTSVGKCGSIRRHCASFNQNKLLLMISAPRRQRITIRSSPQAFYRVLALVSEDDDGGLHHRARVRPLRGAGASPPAAAAHASAAPVHHA